MQKIIIVFAVKNGFQEVARSDAERCKEALKAHFGSLPFTLTRIGESFEIGLDVSSHVLDTPYASVREFQCFASGFMASAKFWER